jgi:cytochrome b involved in lipid metabolism
MATTQQAAAIEISVTTHAIPEQTDVANKVPVVNVSINGAQIIPVAGSTQVGGVIEKPSEVFVERLAPRPMTLREVSEHKSPADLWIVVADGVYDVTTFQHTHPGGHKGKTSSSPFCTA